MTKLAIWHCFLVTGRLYWVKNPCSTAKTYSGTESYYFRCQRKVLSLCHPFLNMPYFFILFSSPLYYILFCARLIVLTSFWPSSSPFSSHPLYPLYPGHPFPSLLLRLLSSPPFYLSQLAFKSQTPEPKAYFTGSGFPLLTQRLVLGAGVTDTSHPNLQLMKGGKKRQIDTIMKEPTFIPLWVSGFDK